MRQQDSSSCDGVAATVAAAACLIPTRKRGGGGPVKTMLASVSWRKVVWRDHPFLCNGKISINNPLVHCKNAIDNALLSLPSITAVTHLLDWWREACEQFAVWERILVKTNAFQLILEDRMSRDSIMTTDNRQPTTDNRQLWIRYTV